MLGTTLEISLARLELVGFFEPFGSREMQFEVLLRALSWTWVGLHSWRVNIPTAHACKELLSGQVDGKSESKVHAHTAL